MRSVTMKKSRAMGLMIRLLLVSIVLTSCAVRVPSANPSSPTSQAEPHIPTAKSTQQQEPPSPPREGSQAYDFTLSDLEGNSVSLRDFRGKSLMLTFWATWC